MHYKLYKKCLEKKVALIVLQFSLQVLALFLNVPPVTTVVEKLFRYEKIWAFLLVLGRETSKLCGIQVKGKIASMKHNVAKKINFTR